MAKLRLRRTERGYVLLDVLVAAFIALVGLAVILGSLGIAARSAASERARVLHLIEQRNANAQNQTIIFLEI
jgi:hypothetical protein